MARKRDANRGGHIDYAAFRPDSRVEQLRIPPQSIDAECAVIGGLMLAPDAWPKIADKLSEADFYRRDHQLIYRAIAEMAEADPPKPYDAVTLGEWFESQGLSEQVAGGADLTELANTTPSAANIVAYAEIVRDKAILRQLIDVGTGIVNDAFQPEGRESSELVEKAKREVDAVGVEKDSDGLRMVGATVKSLWQDLVAESQQTGPRERSTRWHGVNEILDTFQPEDVITLAALTSVGKTAFAMDIAEHYADTLGRHVAVFSLEMSRKQLMMRQAAKRAQINGNKLKTPEELTDDDWRRLNIAIKEMGRMKIAIDDSSGIGVRELGARARRMQKQVPGGLGLIVIDYVQLMKTPDRDTREQGISEVTRSIKGLAKSLKVTILQLSQLNRKAEERGYPILADLRESGSIEQDSDTVMFLHNKGPATVFTVAKQRNGERNVTRKLARELHHFTFRDWDPQTDDQPGDSDKPAPRQPRQYGVDAASAREGDDR